MSFTYPARSSVTKRQATQQSGAQRTTQGTTSGTARRTMQGSPERAAASNPSTSNNLQDRMEKRESGYTMIAPREDRRREIQAQAQKEEEKFKQYKDSQKLSHVSYVGRVGGTKVTEGQARTKAQQKLTKSPMQNKAMSQQYRQAQKKREESQLEKKKMAARQKTEQNVQRETARSKKLQQEHHRVNEAFLSRLEQQQKHTKVRSKQTQPQQSTPGAQCAESPPDGSIVFSQLQAEFPDCDPSVLKEILEACDGDLATVRAMLLGGNNEDDLSH